MGEICATGWLNLNVVRGYRFHWCHKLSSDSQDLLRINITDSVIFSARPFHQSPSVQSAPSIFLAGYHSIKYVRIERFRIGYSSKSGLKLLHTNGAIRGGQPSLQSLNLPTLPSPTPQQYSLPSCEKPPCIFQQERLALNIYI